MQIQQQNLLGNAFVGVFSSSSDNTTLVPSAAQEKFVSAVEETLGTKVVKLNLWSSPLLGIFAVFNDNGIVVSELAHESELAVLEKHFDSVNTITGFTAIGNLASCNNHGCIASPLLSKETCKTLEETLGVQVKQMRLAGLDIIGLSVLATSKGFIANPNITDQELSELQELFGVEGNIGSINYGFPFVKGGLIANKRGAIVGSLTTSYELGRVDEALFLGRESND